METALSLDRSRGGEHELNVARNGACTAASVVVVVVKVFLAVLVHHHHLLLLRFLPNGSVSPFEED